MYPEANIPVIQISLMKSLDPRQHLDLGAALSPLLEENILILGSGSRIEIMDKLIIFVVFRIFNQLR